MVEDSVFAACQLEILLYGDVGGRVKVYLFTDSESSLESIASSKQVDRKTLWMRVVDLKERVIEGDVLSYTWLPTERMWTDLLTKEKPLPGDLKDVLVKNIMDLPETHAYEVRAFGQEVRMINIRNQRAVYLGDEV